MRVTAEMIIDEATKAAAVAGEGQQHFSTPSFVIGHLAEKLAAISGTVVALLPATVDEPPTVKWVKSSEGNYHHAAKDGSGWQLGKSAKTKRWIIWRNRDIMGEFARYDVAKIEAERMIADVVEDTTLADAGTPGGESR